METRDYPSIPSWKRDSVKMYFIRARSIGGLLLVYKEYAFQSYFSWRVFSTRGADSRARLLPSTRAQWPCVFPETKFRSLALIYDEREWKFDFPRSDYDSR